MTTLHERIRGEIERAILSGELRPGDRLPVEHELMRRYGCSRMTVSKAISRLATAGMVERRRREYSFRLLKRAQHHSGTSELEGTQHWLELEGVHYADGRPLAHGCLVTFPGPRQRGNHLR